MIVGYSVKLESSLLFVLASNNAREFEIIREPSSASVQKTESQVANEEMTVSPPSLITAPDPNTTSLRSGLPSTNSPAQAPSKKKFSPTSTPGP